MDGPDRLDSEVRPGGFAQESHIGWRRRSGRATGGGHDELEFGLKDERGGAADFVGRQEPEFKHGLHRPLLGGLAQVPQFTKYGTIAAVPDPAEVQDRVEFLGSGIDGGLDFVAFHVGVTVPERESDQCRHLHPAFFEQRGGDADARSGDTDREAPLLTSLDAEVFDLGPAGVGAQGDQVDSANQGNWIVGHAAGKRAARRESSLQCPAVAPHSIRPRPAPLHSATNRVFWGVAKPPYIELGQGPDAERMPIIYEDRSVMAIDKPRGWMLVPFTWQRTDRNLQAAIQSSIGEGAFWAKSRQLKFLRYVHRLDAETTGVLLFAKSIGATNSLGALFETRQMHKRYLAIVRGVPRQKEWTCELKLDKDPIRVGRMRVDPTLGKASETSFRILETRNDLTLVEALPVTGRTHQIRVHLAESGCPVLGDDIYGGPARVQLALRSVELSYQDPFTRRPVRIFAPEHRFLAEYGFGKPLNAEPIQPVPAESTNLETARPTAIHEGPPPPPRASRPQEQAGSNLNGPQSSTRRPTFRSGPRRPRSASGS